MRSVYRRHRHRVEKKNKTKNNLSPFFLVHGARGQSAKKPGNLNIVELFMFL